MSGLTTAQRSDRVPNAARRPPARDRRRLTRRGVVALLVVAALLAGAVVYLFYGSPWLRVRRVQVTGTRLLTARQVEAASGVPVGDPMTEVDAGAVAARLRAALPRIASVKVTRSWPHSVTLRVTERTAKALLEKNGEFIEVDADGVRFAEDSTAPAGVPTVELTGPAASGASAGKGYFSTEVLLHSAVQVAADLPESVNKQTKVIQVASFDGITLELAGGRSVLWGSPERGAQKADALRGLLKAAPHAVHYDVSAPTAPASSGS